MKVNVTMNGGEIDINIQGSINKSLHQSTQLVRGKAIQNAPVLTGTLRRSITTQIKKNVGQVGTNVKYARTREYINYKNPRTKFYMKRAFESSLLKIQEIFYKNLKDELH